MKIRLDVLFIYLLLGVLATSFILFPLVYERVCSVPSIFIVSIPVGLVVGCIMYFSCRNELD